MRRTNYIENKINPSEISPEFLAKAMQCETAGEMIELAKANGIELTKEEAEAYLEELTDVELDEKMLAKVAGGDCYSDCATFVPSP